MRVVRNVVGACLGQRLVAERNRLGGAGQVVERELQEDIGPLAAGTRLAKQLVQQRDRPVGASREPVEGGRPQPAPARERRIVRRQLGGKLRQLGGGSGRSAGGCLLGGGVEAGRRHRVRAVRGQREVPGLLLDIGDRTHQGPVDRTAPPGRRLLVTDRGQQRVREAQAGVVELDDAFPQRGLECRQHPLAVAERQYDKLDRRPGERGSVQEYVQGLGGKPGQAATKEVPQAFRHANRPPGRRLRVRADQFAPELEGVKRISRGRLVQTRELGPGQLKPELLPEELMHPAQAERPYETPVQPLPGKRMLKIERGRLSASTQRREQAHAVVSEPPQRHLEHGAGGRIDPLDVVQRHHYRPVDGEHPQDVDYGKPDRVRVGALLARLRQQERDRERVRPRRSNRPGGIDNDRAEELRKRRKRERCLRLSTPAGKDATETLPRLRDACFPQNRLADPGLATEKERARAALNAVEEGRDRCQLLIPPDKPACHRATSAQAPPRWRAAMPGRRRRPAAAHPAQT